MRNLLRGLLIVLAAAWIYAPCLHGTWLWDDGLEVTQNLALRSPGGWWEPWVHPLGMDYFPLKGSLQWVEWRLWGANPLGYHLSNLVLHVVSSLLVWRLLSRIGVRTAHMGALIFAVHPLAVESVAWISEFKNTVSLPFLLLSCLAFVEFDSGRRRRAWLLSVLLFVAALACKTSVVMFPFVILLYAWWRRGGVRSRDALDAAPFFLASLGFGVATLWFQSSRAIGASGAQDPLLQRVAQAGWSLLSYARQAVLPLGLAPVYAPARSGIVSIVPWVIVAAVLALFWSRRAGWGRHALLGSGWFLINLVPVLGILPMSYSRISPRADHFAYISLVGYAGLAAACLDGVCAALRAGAGARVTPRLCAAVVIAGAIAALCIESRTYAGVFHDEEALWTFAVARDPGAWIARNNLGKVWLQEGRRAEAAGQFSEAVRLRPDSAEAHANWGTALDALGDPEAARLQYGEALRLDPGFAGAHYDLGLSLLRSGLLDAASAQFQAALAINPAYAEAHNNLGLALAHLGRGPEALDQFRAALESDPGLAEAHLNLGNALFRTGATEAAIGEFHEALRIDPGYGAAHNNLGYALRSLGREAEAGEQFKAAGEGKPLTPPAKDGPSSP